MRESYVSENRFGFKTVNPAIRKIVIVGGRGKLGRLFGHYLQGSGYPVVALEQEDWPQAENILQEADVVIVSVPIANTPEVIECLKPYLTENMLLADLTSVKRVPLQKMLEVHQGAVLGLHPMFGRISPAWQNKWWHIAMGVLANAISGCYNKFKFGVPKSTK